MNKKRFFRLIVMVIMLVCIAFTNGCGMIMPVIADALNEFVSEFEAVIDEEIAPLLPQPTDSRDEELPSFEDYGFEENPDNEDEQSVEEEIIFEDDSILTPYSEMEYVRADHVETEERLYEIAELVNETDSNSELLELFHEGEEIYEHYYTMSILSYINLSLDYSSDYWNEEYEYTNQNLSLVEAAHTEFYSALYDSELKEEIEEEYPTYFDQIDEVDWYIDGTEDLYSEEIALNNKYNNLMSTATIDFEGEELTYEEVYAIEDYYRYSEANEVWQQTYYDELSNIYIDLVKTRQELADVLGFDNYMDIAFESFDYDYTPEMAIEMAEEISDEMVDVYNEAYYANDYIDESFDDYSSFVLSTLQDIDSSLAKAYEDMLDYGLIDYEEAPNKPTGAYETYLPEYNSPLIVLSYNGDSYSISTLMHEFGHFYNDYINEGQFNPSLDMLEAQAQTMSLIFLNYYPEYFGNEMASNLQHNELISALHTFIYQSYIYAFEYEVYALDPNELTPEVLSEISNELAYDYGLDYLTLPGYEDTNMFEWTTIPHIYDAPFYTISYVTSAAMSTQLFDISTTDEEVGVNGLMELFDSDDLTFIEKTEELEILSPFDEECIGELAEMFYSYLI